MCTHTDTHIHKQSDFRHTSRTHTNITFYKEHTKSKQLRSKSLIFLFILMVTIAVSHKISSPVVFFTKMNCFFMVYLEVQSVLQFLHVRNETRLLAPMLAPALNPSRLALFSKSEVPCP